MRIEFAMLGATILLALFNIFWAGNVRTKQYGKSWNVGARDEDMPPLNPIAGRLLRAQANLYETFPLFAASLLGAASIGHLGWKTQIGSVLFFGGRLVYLPLYARGVPQVRTMVWLVALLGLLFTTWAMVFG